MNHELIFATSTFSRLPDTMHVIKTSSQIQPTTTPARGTLLVANTSSIALLYYIVIIVVSCVIIATYLLSY